MLTRNRSPDAGSATACRLAGRCVWSGILTAMLLAVAACGGGGSGGPSSTAATTPPVSTPPPSPPPPAGVGSATVQVTTTSGTPISAVSVALNGSNGGRTATTDADGKAQFTDLIVGEGSAVTWLPGYRGAQGRFSVTRNSNTNVKLVLEKVAEATVVLLATRPVASNDGRTLTVDLDLAVLDSNGAALETLTASDFELDGVCDWYTCVAGPDGRSTGSYGAQVADAIFMPVPARARPAIAAAVLLDQSAEVALTDPTGLRLEAVSNFFASITPPDTVTFGTYQGVPATPALTTYGGFTSDTASFRATISDLAGRELGTNPFYGAIADMIAFTAANTAAGSTELQRSVVAVTMGNGEISECGDAAACWQAMLAAAETGRAAGVSVVAVGPELSYAFQIATRTGGASALVEHPTQLPVIFSALGSIVARSLPYNRVRMALDGGKPGVFLPGGYLLGYLNIHVGPSATISWYVAFPI